MTARLDVREVLCPTDFSLVSERALRHAIALAQRFRSRLTIVHAIASPPMPPDEPLYLSEPVPSLQDLRVAAEHEMRRFLEPATEAGVPVTSVIREGQPWRKILETARAEPADLVVMGTHGRGGFERLLLGSVAEKLLHRLPCPVLTVCHEEGRTWHAPGLVTRVLCAVDFSDAAPATIAYALALADKIGAAATLLHVVETLPDSRHLPYVAMPDIKLYRHQIESWAAERLHELVPPAERAAEPRERIAAGRAYEEILRVAAEESADLIVIGAGEHGALGRMLLGSTAHHVVRAATCPVLTVRPTPVRRPAETGAMAAVS